ncbi:MAG TPA: hypothetical protein VK869_08900 [Rubrobacteraceae bacterium]|nr:hypothetical protein [Rubrobacteraceae bacterium]
MKKLIVVALAVALIVASAMPALAAHRGATGGDVKVRVTKCSQKQAASFRQVQRGDVRAHRGGSAAAIKQKGKIHQKQVNACRHGKAAGGDIRLRR